MFIITYTFSSFVQKKVYTSNYNLMQNKVVLEVLIYGTKYYFIFVVKRVFCIFLISTFINTHAHI